MSGLKDLVKNTGAAPPVRASAQAPAATGLKSLVSSGVGAQSPSTSVTGLKSLVAPKTVAPVANTVTNTVPADTKGKASENNGGFLGGLGYLAEKAYLGFLSSVEGIVDYTAGGIAKMVGADEWAEERFANDWTNYNHADEWYDPGEGWQFAGDVAGGIGTSLPGIAAATIGTIAIGATAGGATPLASKLILGGISSTVAGLGAAGNATKEAYRETGKLTGKEFAYGALSGATEAALEGVSGALGKGTGRIIDDMAKKAAKDTAATVAKSGAKTFFKQLGEDFAQEALEEGLAEILSPQFQKLTYNPDAKDATWQEVLYAAMVGGLSGMVMTGSSSAVNTSKNFFSGKKSVESGTYRGFMESGKRLAESETKYDTGIEVMRSVKETYEQLTNSLMKTNGITSTEALTERINAGDVTFNVKEKMLLGKLKGATTAARFHPYIESCARGLLLDVDRVVKRYDAFGMTDADGKPLTVTKEEILSGIDESLLEKAKTGTLTKSEAKTLNLSIRKALTENTVLSTLATADAVGGIMMNTGKFTQAAMQDESLMNAEDLNQLIERGSPEQIQGFEDSLGIKDLRSATIDEVRARIAEKRVAANPTQQATAMQAQPVAQKTPVTSTNFEKVQAAGDNTRGVTLSEDTRYAFAGEKASSADKMKLMTAEQMLKNGVNAETVRRETGWFKGYDGKWRFEIDDFDSSLIENPKLQEHMDDGEVYFTGKMSDIFDHKALFSAYHELKDINIVIQKTEFGTDAIYQPNSNYITISKELFRRQTKAYKEYLNGGRKAEIDRIEASEAYKRYNKLYDDDAMENMEPTAWLEAEKKAREEFYSSDIGKRYYELTWGKSGFLGEKFELGWSQGAKAVLLHELQHAVQNIEGFAKGTSTRDNNYDRNAGEIEARNVEKRVDFTEEQRKNIRPDIDRTDVVIKYSSSENYVVKKDKDGREYWEIDSGKDIFKGLKTPEEYRDAAYSYLIANRDNKIVVRDNFGRKITFIRLSAEEFTRSKESNTLFEDDPNMYTQKMRLIPSLEDILLHSNVNWNSPDHKKHKLFKGKGFENYRGRVRIDNVIFNTIVRVGKARFGDIFYDINLEVDSYLPHANSSASDINKSTSTNSILQNPPKSNTFSENSSEISSDDGTRRALSEKTARNSEKNSETAKKSSVSMTAEEIDAYARENIEEYRQLNEPSKAAVRMTVRQARASGLTDTQTLTYAKVAARSGLNIIFDAEKALGDGSIKGNTIYINPKNSETRTREVILGHEMFHRLFATGGKKAMRLYREAWNLIPEERQKEVRARYLDHYEQKGTATEVAKQISEEEVATAGAEEVFKIPDVWEYLLGEEPTLADKVVRFFYGSARKYSGIDGMPAAARKFIRHYKKLFAELSERNQGTNALSLALEGQNIKKTPVTSINSKKMHVTGDGKEDNESVADSGKRYAIVALEDGKIYVEATRRVITGTTRAEQRNDITKFFKALLKNKPSLDIHTIEGDILTITMAETAHKARDDYKQVGGQRVKMTDEEFAVKSRIETHIDEVSEVSQKRNQKSDNKGHSFAGSGFSYRRAYFRDFDGKYYEVTLSIGNNGTVATVYNIGKMQESVSPSAKIMAVVGSMPLGETLSNNSIPEKREKSNTFSKKTSEISSDDGTRHALPENPSKPTEVDPDGPITWSVLKASLEQNAKDQGKQKELYLASVVYRGLPGTTGSPNLSAGEIKKMKANYTHERVYSKKNAFDLIDALSGAGSLLQKTKSAFADKVWQALNDCETMEEKRAFARDAAEYWVAKVLTEGKNVNPDYADYAEQLTYFRTGIGSLAFREEELTELLHTQDKDGLKRILARWGNKKSSEHQYPMDVFVTDIAREMPGMAYLEEMHPTEAFLEIDALYQKAKEGVKDKWISSYEDMPDTEIPAFVQSIESEIMRAFAEGGEKSKFQKHVEERIGYFSDKAAFWKSERDNIRGRDRLLGLLVNQAQKMKELKHGTYGNATQMDNDLFKSSIAQLSRIQFRGNLNSAGTRKIFGDLLAWYRKENLLLEYKDEENRGYYNQSVADMLTALATTEGGFSKAELSMMYDVMSYFIHFVENYGKIWRNGKMVEALPEAKRYIKTLRENEGLHPGIFMKLFGARYVQKYAEAFGDPASVVRRMDYYANGFFTETFEEFREAAVNAEVTEMQIMAAYDEFLKENKRYIENATKELVNYRGYKIPRAQLIDLYLSMKRRHAWAGLAFNGFVYTDLAGKQARVPGFVTDDKISYKELESAVGTQQEMLGGLLTKADRQYIAILERVYNEDARKLKADRDIQKQGFTNATNDYYYPVRRAYMAQNIDTSEIRDEYDRVSNSSFNKDTVKGAKQELMIESADTRFRRHIHAVCQYACLSPAVETFNRLYNLDVDGNSNRPVSVKTESQNTWRTGEKYFKKLLSDIQGIPASSSEGMAQLAFIRGSYAKFQLGANPKVWLTQISSIFAASGMLDADCMMRGMGLASKDVDKYCSLAKLRSYDNTAAMAQAVLDKSGRLRSAGARALGKTSKLSDALMTPIGKMDRFVVGRIFGACQAQIEKNGGAKVGTEENKIEAGKLLTKVILETQQNSIATERSAAMRSGNEFLRTATMFTADSMKVLGRLVDGLGEVAVMKARIKNATDADTKDALKASLKAARLKTGKALGAMVLTALFMTAIAQLFRWLYDKEQEDEPIEKTLIVDAVGNLFGGLPLIRDAYSYLFEGYDVDNYAYSTFNDLLSSTKRLFSTTGSIIMGEATSQEIAAGTKSFINSVGQFTGLPTRNLYNVFYGLTKRFSPTTAYKIDNVFYEKNYKNDFYKAIENEDAEMATYLMSLLYNERLDERMSETVHKELYGLSAKGHKVLPKSAPSEITVDGVEYEVTSEQQEAIRRAYSTVTDALEKLFANASYRKLDDEARAEAVNYVYDLYYDAAIESTLGIDKGNTVLFSKALGADTLALFHLATRGIASDKDEDGKTVSGSKRKKVIAAINRMSISTEEKLLLICSKGYKLQDGDVRGMTAERAKKYLVRYILGLRITKDEKAALASACGFEVKNGKILAKSLT